MNTKLTEDEITKAFENTNFGTTDYRRLLAISVMKRALRYECGYTITRIMEKLNLIDMLNKAPTTRGREFCYDVLDGKDGG